MNVLAPAAPVSVSDRTHVFTEAGLGTAPFEFIGFWSAPERGLQSANPAGFAAAMQDAPRADLGGPNACHYCGTYIVNHCLIRNARGKTFFVGTDCVEKTGDEGLRSKAKLALAKFRREQKEARRAAAWEAGKPAREQAAAAAETARLEREAAEARRLAPVVALLAPLATRLADGQGGFRDSVAADLRAGRVPSGRGASITLDILARAAGRRNSRAYDEAYEAAGKTLDEADAALAGLAA